MRRVLAALAFTIQVALAQEREIEVMRTGTAVAIEHSSGRVDLGTYHALLIAVENYAPHHPDLATPIADATALRDLLIGEYFFAAENVEVLIDADATREAILDALDGFAQRLGRDDNLFVFYAGHGTAKWRHEDFAEGFWVPHGATERWSTWLSSHTLRRSIERIRARHVFLISDSCFSGAINDRDVIVDDAPEDIRRFARDPSCQLLASGQWEVVSDVGRHGHSVFAWHLLRALRTAPRYLTARDLASGIIGEFRGLIQRREVQQMPEWDPELIRQLGSSGQFVLVHDIRATPVEAVAIVNQPGVPAGWMLPARVRAILATTQTRAPKAANYTFVHDEFGVPVEMVLVPAGSFRIDSSIIETEPFLIDRHEVTNQRIANFKNRERPNNWPNKDPVHSDAGRAVTNVSLDDARRFARWARKRLPTITEWRFAAGGSGVARAPLRRFPWGDTDLAAGGSARHAPVVGSDLRDTSWCGALGLGRGVQEWCELDPPEPKRGAACGGRDVRTLEERMRGTAPSAHVMHSTIRAAHERELARIGFRCVLPLVPRRK